MSGRSLLLGIDAGTRAVRAGLFTAKGELLAAVSREYDYTQPKPGWAEQDPFAVWGALVAAVRGLLQETGPQTAGRIGGLALDGTAVTMVTCDAAANPLGPAILWMDTRAAAEAAEISATGDEVLAYTGGSVSAEWLLPKALWVKRNQPERYARTQRLAELSDWLNYRLTGRWTASLNVASAEWSYVSHLGGYPRALLAAIGLSDLTDRLPPVVLAPGALVGSLTPEAGAHLGLRPGIPVAQGLMDSYAAALGLNIFAPGRMALSLGTSSAYLALTAEPRYHPALLGPVPDAFGPGTWVIQGGQTSAGAIPGWYTRELAGGADFGALDAEAALVPPGSDGLVALDCWQGNRTPYRDPRARGAMVGLHLRHSRAHVYRALLEAVAFGGRQILETMAEAGVRPDELSVCGGGVRSRLWLQIHADVLGIPLVVAPLADTATLGSAMCAAVAAGLYPNLAAAAAAMCGEGRRILPDPDASAKYAVAYGDYRALYPLLKEMLHRLADHA